MKILIKILKFITVFYPYTWTGRKKKGLRFEKFSTPIRAKGAKWASPELKKEGKKRVDIVKKRVN